MPNQVYFESEDRTAPVATEEELLEFVNKGRKAGGANLLEALLPSVPSESSECLIANALNFSCAVLPSFELTHNDDAILNWYMAVPTNMDIEQVEVVAEALDLVVDRLPNAEKYQQGRLGPLPAHIGNAAQAFDDGLAFQEYRR